MRSLAIALLAVLLSATPADPREERIRVVYSEDVAFDVAATSRIEMSLVGLELTVDGEPIDLGFDPAEMEPDVQVDELHWHDEITEVDEEGQPVALTRSFGALERSETSEGEETEKTGVLAERSIELERDGDEVVARLTDRGDDVDGRFLEGHRLAFQAIAYLPEDEVEPGDTWTVGEEVLAVLLGEGPELFEDDEDEDDGFTEMMREALSDDVAVEVTYEGLEERDGIECWKLSYEGEVAGELEGADPEELGFDTTDLQLDPDDAELDVSLEVTAEGRVWIAREARLILAEEYEGEFELTMVVRAETEEAEIEWKLTAEGELEGELECTAK